MVKKPADKTLPDSSARMAALADHNRSLLVEAGAGSGKTALMAGRVALLLAGGVHPKDIVAITFTEAAAAELQERIERTVQRLLGATIPIELAATLPKGLSAEQRNHLESGAAALDEITCTTIHGFCQQLIKPYPVETGIDPGAAIIDPAAAELAYQDLMDAWLSARFGRDRGSTASRSTSPAGRCSSSAAACTSAPGGLDCRALYDDGDSNFFVASSTVNRFGGSPQGIAPRPHL